MNRHVAMISFHECPLAAREGKEQGGINVYTFELSKALTLLGWQVDMFTRKQDTINPDIVEISKHVRIIHLPAGPTSPLHKKELFLHVEEFSKNLLKYAARTNTSYSVVHAHYYYSGMVAKHCITRLMPVPQFIMTYHTLGIMKQLVSNNATANDILHRIQAEQDISRVADAIITASITGKQYLTSFYNVPKNKINVIPPGVDTTLFRPMNKKNARYRIGADRMKRLILSVGRIDPVKGFDVLLAAVKILLSSHPKLNGKLCLYIVGGDVGQDTISWNKELERLNALRTLLNLTATVQFILPQPQERLPDYYNAADVVVMPSHYESFGMVALEALSCSTPVIATDVTGISPMLKSLPHGHIVSANNPLLLAKQIKHVLFSKHRKSDIQYAVTQYDWINIAKRVATIYAQS